MIKNHVHIVEVGPRDGLQNEKRLWSIEERGELIRLLAPCGFREIEVGSFVSPKWIPQMAGTDQIFLNLKELIESHPATHFSALVPNDRGMEQALLSGVKDISIFTAASEAFCHKNINCSIEESFGRFESILNVAKVHNIRVRGYVSCVIECPYSGAVSPDQVSKVAARLREMGCREISLGDTIGKGTPETTTNMIRAVKDQVPVESLAIHCHDTYGNALENILACLDEGVRVVDAAINGLGGCPYGGSNAKGNVATELVVRELPKHGYTTFIDEDALKIALDYVRSF